MARPKGVTMPCGWGCGEQLTATEMRGHFSDCPKRPVVTIQTEHGKFEVDLELARANGIDGPVTTPEMYEAPKFHPVAIALTSPRFEGDALDLAEMIDWRQRCFEEFGQKTIDQMKSRNPKAWDKMSAEAQYEALVEMRERGE